MQLRHSFAIRPMAGSKAAYTPIAAPRSMRLISSSASGTLSSSLRCQQQQEQSRRCTVLAGVVRGRSTDSCSMHMAALTHAVLGSHPILH